VSKVVNMKSKMVMLCACFLTNRDSNWEIGLKF
jgi:hypothetical protein